MAYRQLRTEEKYQIAVLRRQERSRREIARELRRHPGAIVREVGRIAAPYDGAYRLSHTVEMTTGRRRDRVATPATG